MNRLPSKYQDPTSARDSSFVTLIGRAFLHAFGGRLEATDRGERPEPCRQEDYDLLERHRRTKR